MYYAHASVYMIDKSVADIAPWAGDCHLPCAAGRRLGLLRPALQAHGLAREKVLAVVMVVFLTLVAWGLSHVFSGRAMYLQVGAMMGTIMAWNVFFVIIPAQRKLVEAKERNEAPDAVYGLQGKQRSVHNNYFTLPVLFIMISNHYPMTFGYKHAWLVLIAIAAPRRVRPALLQPAAQGPDDVGRSRCRRGVAALLLAVAIAPSKPQDAAYSFADVQKIVAERCATCHAARPTQPGFNDPPKGFMLDTPALIVTNAQKINEQAVISKVMPIGNLTNMTDAERGTLAAWIAAGAPAK